MADAYHTVAKESTHRLTVKNSQFIALVTPAATAEEIQSKLSAIRKQEYTANHHCYAWRLGIPPADTFKYSDDGEPTGTAGRPLFDLLKGRQVTNVLLVVTRYFGGTKLGTGPLARAYTDTAIGAIDLSGVVEQYLTSSMRIIIEHSFFDRLSRLLQRLEASTTKSEFAERVLLECTIRQSRVDELRDELRELTSGRAIVELLHA